MNLTAEPARRFNRLTLGTALLLLALVALFNLCVDPYQMYRLVLVDGLNRLKPQMGTHLRLAKAYILTEVRPEGIILGDSRTERALDPDHPGWNPGVQGHYNLALPGGSIYVMLRYFQHAHAVHPLKQVVIGLDLTNFGVPQPTEAEFSEARLWVQPDGSTPTDPVARWSQTLQDQGAALLSLDSLTASVKTIALQHYPTSATRQLNGLDPMSLGPAFVQRNGHRFYFRLNASQYLGVWSRGFTIYDPTTHTSPSLEHFKALVEFCRREGIDLKVYIHPVHANLLEAFRVHGLWSDVEDWKRFVVQILAADAQTHPAAQPFRLWDFSGYTSVTTEPVPAAGDTTTQMRWYWDSTHYKKALGDLILDRVFGYRDAQRPIPKDFGVLLTPQNLETHLADIRQAQTRYQQTHPAEVQEVEAMDRAARRN
ncbi:hypothetical protein [Anthocerotibacter panamensis]|uniref:hypothetical protein n=1 Tax=Anthocerotibacter panamensis TaxID=2857077 RepID=UPI001C403484|nr:hypothetical protein [Anthocerotibacter panamensis]